MIQHTFWIVLNHQHHPFKQCNLIESESSNANGAASVDLSTQRRPAAYRVAASFFCVPWTAIAETTRLQGR